MNAHRQIIKPTNGFLKIEIPEDMKAVQTFEVFVVEAAQATAQKKKPKSDLSKLAGILKDLPQEEKNKMDQFFIDIRNKWERDI
jgi:hypothetical protein